MKSRKEKPVVDEAVEELVEELQSFVEPEEEKDIEEAVKEVKDVLKNYTLVRANTNLNIRQEASINSMVVGSVVGNELLAIDTVENGNWGKLADGRGYVCLDYTKKEED